MKAQEVFDKVVAHLRTQGCQSLIPPKPGSPALCAYRGENGLKCAAGVLIPDEAYLPSMEGKAFHRLLKSLPDFALAHPWMLQHQDLIEELQNVHDESPVDRWEIDFRHISARFGVIYHCP